MGLSGGKSGLCHTIHPVRLGQTTYICNRYYGILMKAEKRVNGLKLSEFKEQSLEMDS